MYKSKSISEAINELKGKHRFNIYVTLKRKSFDYSIEFLKDLLTNLRECDLVDKHMDLYSLEETIVWHLIDFYTVQENKELEAEKVEELKGMYGNDWECYIPEFKYEEIKDPIVYIVMMFKKFKEEK